MISMNEIPDMTVIDNYVHCLTIVIPKRHRAYIIEYRRNEG